MNPILLQMMAAANKSSGTAEVSARYWRVLATGETHYASDNYFQVAEIAFYETTDCAGTNLSLSATVDASSEFSGFPASQAADNNNGTEWCTNSSSTCIGEWFRAYFSTDKTIKSVAIQTHDRSDKQMHASEFKVQYSNDGSSWSDLSTHTTLGTTSANEWLQFTDLQ